ncbi:MAG: helicase-related protein, partial [Sphingomonas sp.]
AQIAGRAGRHQRDGTFGALSEDGPGAFTADEIEAIEDHHFPLLEKLYWREGDPDLSSVDALIADLERRPDHAVLKPAPEAIDLAVLKRLAAEEWVRARSRSRAMVARLWSACSVPDFRKTGADAHARFVAKLFDPLSSGKGHIPHDWFAAELARLDNVQGDVETIAGRIAAARSWAYIAHRADWLAEPAHWAAQTRALEERLSDALHASLTQRFVDKRTTMLLRQIGADARALPVTIAADGEVLVEDHAIGRLDGFRFTVDARAGHADKKLLLAAAERRLGVERGRRGEALAAAADDALALADDPAGPVILWQGHRVARLNAAPNGLAPHVALDRALDCLAPAQRNAIRARLQDWLTAMLARHVPGLVALAAMARDAQASGAARAVAAAMVAGNGVVARASIDEAIASLDAETRRRLRKAGVTIGTLDLFDARLLKGRGAAWRRALQEMRTPGSAGDPSAPVLSVQRDQPVPHGYRLIGRQALRVDLVERIARAAHDARQGRDPFPFDFAPAAAMGLRPETLARLMQVLGFRARAGDGHSAPHWQWHGIRRPRRGAAIAAPSNAF